MSQVETLSLPVFLIVGLVTTAFSCFLVELIRKIGGRRLLDFPNERSSHTTPVPRGGGMAIVSITILGCLVGPSLLDPSRLMHSTRMVFLCAAVPAAVGWLDDLRSLPVGLRLAAQITAALAALTLTSFSGSFELPVVGPIELGFLAASTVGLFCIVGVANIYNFMDGIDGLAASQAVTAGLFWTYCGWHIGNRFVGLVGLLVVSSCLGFLVHNWPPARIFMGDVGSSFLGFSFAGMAIVTSGADPRIGFGGLLVMWPFLADGTFTLIRRLARRENIFDAHRSHLYQRLVIGGFSHEFVTILYSTLALVGLVLAVLWVNRLPYGGALGLGVPAGAFLILYSFVARFERRRPLSRTGTLERTE